MDDILHSLRPILLNSIPTFCFLLFLVWYLRTMYFGPFARLLKQRYEATEGAKKAAEESLRQAELRVAEYEEQLRAARNEIYAQQDKALKNLEAEQSAQLETVRREAETKIGQARGELAAEVEQAKGSLNAQSSDLADQIVARILGGRAA
jgi:F0F1-type ATP synthase membrane subunit b/b'